MANRKRKTVPKINTNSEICFVIMPFGNWFDTYYQDIYCPAIIQSGLKPKRADDLYRPSNIVQDIWRYTKQAKIILADLSQKNPNVFYELGLAHALAKPAILITENIEDIPFDLRSLRIIEYNKNLSNWGEILIESIKNAIKETLESPNETIPTAFLETISIPKTKITPEEKTYLELREEIDQLKREVRTGHITITNSPPITINPKINSTEETEFMRPMLPSPELSKITGGLPLPRTEIVKVVWNYIKKNKLQDSKNPRNIKADSNLQRVFGGKKVVSMFEMTKHINQHLSPAN